MTVLDLTTALVVGGLFAAGFFLLLQRTLMRLLFGFLILGHATNLLLLAAAGPPGAPPIMGEVRAGAEPDADPLPQAMALTAIVITFALTILLLALVHRAWQLHGHDEVRDDAEDRRIAENQQREHTDADRADREQRPDPPLDPTSRSLAERPEEPPGLDDPYDPADSRSDRGPGTRTGRWPGSQPPGKRDNGPGRLPPDTPPRGPDHEEGDDR